MGTGGVGKVGDMGDAGEVWLEVWGGVWVLGEVGNGEGGEYGRWGVRGWEAGEVGSGVGGK